MKKLFVVCFATSLLSFGVSAQNEAEAVLMILDKESNLPICQLSDQVKINSDFIPEDRIGDVDAVSIEDVRVCEEEDVWNAVEEEMLVGMAVGFSHFSTQQILITLGIGGLVGCFTGVAIQHDYQEAEKSMPPAALRFVGQGLVGALIGIGVGFKYLLEIPLSSSPTSGIIGSLALGASSAIVAGEICKDRF